LTARIIFKKDQPADRINPSGPKVIKRSSPGNFFGSVSFQTAIIFPPSLKPCQNSMAAHFVIAVAVSYLANSVAADFPDCVNGPLKSNGVCDATLDAVSRAQALIAEFTSDEKIANLNNAAPGVSRLGLPSYEWWSEALHGVAGSPGVSFASSGNYSSATSFPQPITLGAAFDDDLIYDVATVVSTEGRAFNNVNRAG
jgi:beta-D-xylosidase 4